MLNDIYGGQTWMLILKSKVCEVCVHCKSSHNKSPIHSWKYQSQQWKMNTFGFCMSIHWIYDLIAVDMYSKWTEVGVMKLRDLHLV